MGVEEEGNNTRTGAVNQISPRKVKRDNILPLRPHSLENEAGGMANKIIFMTCGKGLSDFGTALSLRRFCNVVGV